MVTSLLGDRYMPNAYIHCRLKNC